MPPSATATRDAAQPSGRAHPATATGRPHRLPVATRERRPALLAAGLVLVVAGALGSALVVHRSGDRVEVLVARSDIAPGERITTDDLGVALVAADGATVVPAASLANFVGTVATSRIPAQTLVTPAMFLAGDTVPAGAAVVGLVLAPEQRPSEALEPGDVVRAFLVTADGSSTVSGRPAGTTLLEAARVVAGGAGGTATGGDTVSLLLPVDAASDVVAAAAAGQVALVRLADGTTPSVDLLGD